MDCDAAADRLHASSMSASSSRSGSSSIVISIDLTGSALPSQINAESHCVAPPLERSELGGPVRPSSHKVGPADCEGGSDVLAAVFQNTIDGIEVESPQLGAFNTSVKVGRNRTPAHVADDDEVITRREQSRPARFDADAL